MNSPLKIAVTSLLLIGLACFAVGCGSGDSASQPVPASIPGASGDAVATVDTTTGNASATGLQSEFTGAPKATFEDLHPEVAIKTSEGEITVRLDAENAKYTVENFLENYVDRGPETHAPSGMVPGHRPDETWAKGSALCPSHKL